MKEKDPEQPERASLDVQTEVHFRLIERLAESEKQHRELLAELPDVVFRLDESGCVRFLNEAWSAQLGFEIDSTLGQELTEFIHRGDREKWVGLVLPAGKTSEPDRDRVVRFIDNEGVPHWMSVRARRIETGEIVGSLEDVTIRRQLETELLRAQRLESIGRLAGGLAHDFNNLLTVILGNVNLAQTRLGKKAIELSELELAKRACDHASQLTKQMLTFSKGGEPVRQSGSLVKLVRDAVDLALRGSSVRPVFTIDDMASPVDMDASQIHQVLNNLIMNAEQAMPNGGTLRVHVREQLFTPEGSDSDAPQRGVAVEFRDTGCGIPKENLDHILEPYFTTKETGNGLGLTSVYWIVKRHGGLLEIESAPGIGTLVRVVLPAAECPIQSETSLPEGRATSESGRVLVMDDDENVRASIAAMLEEIGYQVLTTRDGAECVHAYDAALSKESEVQAFDVVILDLTVAGGRDGLWAIERLREIDKDVLAIVASGYSNAPVMADYAKYGFSGVLAKPFLLEDLAEAVGRLIEKAAQRSEDFIP